MATSSYDSVYGLDTGRISVPVGATLAVLVEPVLGQVSIQLKYISGGTLEIVGVSTGVTLTAAQLATRSGTDYLYGSSEIQTLDGPARFYLSSTGATTVVAYIRGKSQGT